MKISCKTKPFCPFLRPWNLWRLNTTDSNYDWMQNHCVLTWLAHTQQKKKKRGKIVVVLWGRRVKGDVGKGEVRLMEFAGCSDYWPSGVILFLHVGTSEVEVMTASFNTALCILVGLHPSHPSSWLCCTQRVSMGCTHTAALRWTSIERTFPHYQLSPMPLKGDLRNIICPLFPPQVSYWGLPVRCPRNVRVWSVMW